MYNFRKNIKKIPSNKIKPYLSYGNTSIIEVIKKINATTEKFQIIIDKKKKIIGTLTDGDIRRSLVKGKSINDIVNKCMNKKPIIGKVLDNEENIKKIEIVDRFPPFLPLVDKNRIVKEIIVGTEEIKINSAVIMAGGLGSRLGKITEKTPKPLLKIGGKTIIDHCIQILEEGNINNIYISVNHLKHKIMSYINKKKSKLNFSFVEEKKKLGTVGSLSLITNKVEFPLIVMNSDLITNLSIKSFIRYYNQEKFDALIGAVTYEHQSPFGVLKYNKTGNLEAIEEKPIQKHLIAAGIYIINKKTANLLNFNKKIDMPELITLALKKNLNLGVFPIHEKWVDIGRPIDFKRLKANF